MKAIVGKNQYISGAATMANNVRRMTRRMGDSILIRLSILAATAGSEGYAHRTHQQQAGERRS